MALVWLWCSFGVALVWLWCGFGVALGSQSVAYRLPTKWLWGGFEVTLYSGVYAEYMPTIWLWVALTATTQPPRAGDNELRFQQPRRRKHNQLLGFHARTIY